MILLQQGAEAQIFLNSQEGTVVKKRLKKEYRHPTLDLKITKKRTCMEFTLLKKLQSKDIVPKVFGKTLQEITMEYIPGMSLKELLLENSGLVAQIAKESSTIIKEMHNENIIHGDLTYFGLGFISRKDEDKAVDLYVLKKSLDPLILEEFWKEFIDNYSDSSVLNRLLTVENRGRKISQ